MSPYPEIPLPRIRRAAQVARFLFVVVLLSMFAGTHYPLPFSLIPQGIDFADKLNHFGAYMLLALSMLAGWELSTGVLQPAHYFVVWLVGALYGVVDEVTQPIFNRYCDGADWFADLTGLVIGLILFSIMRPLMYRALRPKQVVTLSSP